MAINKGDNLNWREVWKEVMAKGRKQEKGITHILDKYDITTVMATCAFFEPNEGFLAQVHWDLTVAKYKVFDWVAMLLMGRHRGYGENAEQLKAQQYITRIMAEAYLNGNGVKGFIDILRTVDYQVREPMEIEW